MTIHFVNLVNWRYFISNKLTDNVIHIDSVSLMLLIRIIGKKRVKRNPGVRFVKSLKEKQEEYLWLTAFKTPFLGKQIVLDESLVVENFDCDKIKPACTKVMGLIIGISSPKQDKLATLINNNLNNQTIFCLGAAVYIDAKSNNRFDFFGFFWLKMLLIKPKRTLSKIKLTLREIILICLIKQEREKFQCFVELIKD